MSAFRKILFIALSILCLFPFIETPIALLLGLIVSLTIGNPYQSINGKLTKILLQVSVVGLGFGMNIYEAFEVGKSGLLFTAISIITTIIVGAFLGRIFKTERNTSTLISSGTAICGGSAIAAVAPVIDANESETSVSLATIFILNSVALLIFPYIGHLFSMNQEQFGFWAAIAIHDTSSVVGAAQKYGDEALHLATTIKLERALWIIPLSLFFAFIHSKNDGKHKMYIPYFIFLYIVAMILNSFVPLVQSIAPIVVVGAKKCMTLTLFLIGAGLSKQTLKSIGLRPLLQGVLLWIFISVGSLIVILKII